jgi:hypothetical protein
MQQQTKTEDTHLHFFCVFLPDFHQIMNKETDGKREMHLCKGLLMIRVAILKTNKEEHKENAIFYRESETEEKKVVQKGVKVTNRDNRPRHVSNLAQRCFSL